MNKETAMEATKNPQPLVPPVDIVENVDGITLTADMPGVGKDGLSVNLEGDQLTIEGAVSLNEPSSLKNVYAEVRVDRYRRTFALGRDLDTERIDASLQNGVAHTCPILQNLVIPEPHDGQPLRRQPSRSAFVVADLLRVPTAVELDHQRCFGA